MSDLLPELVEEILCRVPAISLKRLRSTCKLWNALFKDQRFAKKHFDTPKQISFIMLHENKVFPLSVNLLEIEKNIAAPLIDFKGELGLIENPKEIQFHCDGLLLCTTKNDGIVVWNPCTGETKFLIPRNNGYSHFSVFMGYENNKSCRNYKILRFCIIQDQDRNSMIIEFEIYEFLSNTWRVLEVTANLFIRSLGVSLKGNTYWLANDDYLLSFDFSTERFGYYCLPFERDTHHYCSDEALSIVREAQLSVLHQRHDTNTIEIWVATSDKIDETIVLSWTKFLTINGYKLSGYHHFSSWINFFIAEEKKVVVCCDSICRDGINENNTNMILVIGENGVYREIRFGESFYKSGLAYILNYVPSLVQIQQSTVMP